MMQAPVIETERLRLRPLAESDLASWSGVTSDPRVMHYIGGATLSREETWRRILATAGAWPVLGFGYWAIERRNDGRMVGHAGFADFKRELTPSIENMPEMGWVFAPEAQGQGYAREAVAAGLDWADRHLLAPEIVAIIDNGNEPSIRLAEWAGFTVGEEGSYKGEPILIFRRRRA